MKRLAASLMIFFFGGLPVNAEQTFGLVIGIDDYTYIPKLHGAVNDARDIASALDGVGAEVTLLIDGEATRAAVLKSWHDVLDKASPGDRLIVSYAGHGSNEPEHTAGSERDGRDENFLLAGFAPRGEAAGQRILDDEIALLLEQSSDLEVIFVADACHSGTVTRNLNPVLGYRYVEAQSMTADPLPPPPPPSRSEGKADVALFLAAVNETEKVPEVLIDGKPRGALSYAFASGLRGEADLDRNGILTKGELETHVRRTVRRVSDGVQLPQSEPAGQENRALILVEERPAPSETPLTEQTFGALPPVAVAPGWGAMPGTVEQAPSDLRREGQIVYSAVGDPVAVAPDRRTQQAVVDKLRLTHALQGLALPPLSIGFTGGDRTYLDGEDMTIRVSQRQTPYLTLFNLGSDGTISLLYPIAQFDDRVARPPDDQIELPVRITAPFGADHVVAIETDTPSPVLHRALADLSGSRNMAALWDVIRGSGGRIALFPFFTSGGAL